MTRSSDLNGRAQDSPHLFEKVVLELVVVGAIALSCFQLWQSLSGSLGATLFRPIHLTWIIVLTFLHYPLARERNARVADVLLSGLALYCGYVIVSFDYRGIDHILNGLSNHEFACGLVFVVLLLEATRRSLGWVMVALGALFIVYNAYGNVLPDVVANRGFSFERIVRFQVFSGAGLFGAPLGIAAGTVFMFVLFGAFLEVTGAGRFFIDLAFAGAGRYRGGPAKASVLASAAMGSISGSAIANTVTTGSLTIPMMKQLGYEPEQAAGIEAAASTGGQIMPPIMGAGAFIMAEFTNTPYNAIVVVSIAPAILYFACTLLFVHLMAAKLGLRGMSDTPPLGTTLRNGFHFFYPLVIVTVLLLLNYSPMRVGAVGVAIVVLTGALRTGTRVDVRTIFEGLKRGALMALPISAACATAGIVVGVIGQTGIGLQFTESVVELAGDALWVALILIAVAALILGMGLPVTAAYIVLSVMAAPALSDLGLPIVVAHMIIFWFSQTSNVTPPIALAAFAAAGIAEARPMASAMEAFKLSAGFFIIPVMMAYSSLLLIDGVSLPALAWSIAITLAAIIAVAVAAEGYAVRATTARERWLLAFSAALLIYPDERGRLLGLAVTAATLAAHGLRVRSLTKRLDVV
jgi:TRAP transporter 4TM/12TM fusion protein